VAEIQWASSWTDVANNALKSIGKAKIHNIGDADPVASYCRQFLPTAIETLLPVFDFQAARARAVLNKLVETPPFGFAYYYQLPPDYICTSSIDAGGQDYTIEGDKLLTDAIAVNLVYIRRIQDPTTMAPYVRNGVSAQLALFLSVPLSSAEELVARVQGQLEAAKAIAKRADARGRKQKLPTDDLGFTWYDELR
jgi:hypothetical protein